MKTYTFDEIQDELIGPIGTPRRDKYEYDLQMDLIGSAIRQARKERHLTQEELAKLTGLEQTQISRLESNAGNSKVDTVLQVFSALKAKVKLQIELPDVSINVSK